MNNAKTACEYIVSNHSIDYLTKKHNLSEAEVVKAIFNFMKSYPESSWHEKIERKLKIDIKDAFLAFPGRRDVFLEKYGFDKHFFFQYIYSIIEDYTIVPSEAKAEKLYIKLLDSELIITKYVPKRIIKRIASLYINSVPVTQKAIACLYNTSRGIIASILRRGIAENIIDDVTAEKVYIRVNCNMMNAKSYAEAFNKRDLLKSESSM